MPPVVDTSQNHGRIRAPTQNIDARPITTKRATKAAITAMKSAANGCVAYTTKTAAIAVYPAPTVAIAKVSTLDSDRTPSRESHRGVGGGSSRMVYWLHRQVNRV